MFFSKKPPFTPLFSADGTHYELVTSLGVGRTGEAVMTARPYTAGQYGRWVLVRALPKELGKAARRQLEYEVGLARCLDHPHIARVHGVYNVKGTLYVVSEYVDGVSLDTIITFAAMRHRPYTEAFTLYVGASVASALHHAHTRTDESGVMLEIVHRDVISTRIRMNPAGQVKLGDFGLASSRLQLSRATSVWRKQGDVYYASPEQLLGGKVDARSDLFCLGLVMLELATGRYLFAESSITLEQERTLVGGLPPEDRERVRAACHALPGCPEYVVAKALTLSPEDVARATDWLSGPFKVILHKLLCRNPDDRYQSATELVADLHTRRAEMGLFGPQNALHEVLDAQSTAMHSNPAVEISEALLVRPLGADEHPDHKTTEPK